MHALYKLAHVVGDDSATLGGTGLGQFCFWCCCRRGCDCSAKKRTTEQKRGEPCAKCKDSCKISIGSLQFSILRDNLELNLGVPLSKLVYCILHAELRNTGMCC